MPSTARASAASAIESTPKGYTPIDHDYFDVLPGKIRGLAQYVAIGYILRKTLGQERKKGEPAPEWAEVTHATLAEKAHCSEREIEISMDDAVARKLIARAKTKRGYRVRAVPYKCELTVKNDDGVEETVEFPGWAKAKGYRPPLATVPSPKQPATAGAAEEGAAAEARGPKLVENRTVRHRSRPKRITVQPGQSSDRIDVDEPIEAVVYRNDSPHPITVEAKTEGDVLLVSIAQYPNFSSGIQTHGSDGDTRTAVRVSKQSSVDSKRDSRLDELREGLNPLFLSLYKKLPDEEFLAGILSRLRGKSVARYIDLVHEELKLRPHPRRTLFLNWTDDTPDEETASRIEGSSQKQAATSTVDPAERIRVMALALEDIAKYPGDAAIPQQILNGLKPTEDELAAARAIMRVVNV